MPPLSLGSQFVKPGVMNEAATMHDAMGAAFGLIRGIRDGIVAGAALQRAGGRPGAPYVWVGALAARCHSQFPGARREPRFRLAISRARRAG